MLEINRENKEHSDNRLIQHIQKKEIIQKGNQ